MKPADAISLSSSVTVKRYRALEKRGDRRTIGHFVVERFDERFFLPVDRSTRKHGFASMAMACLAIETLESFYQGLASTRGRSSRMFKDFFARDTALKQFGCGGDWFYRDIRCGLLHQGEARGGWRIHRRGPMLDKNARTVNATLFIRALRRAVVSYGAQLENDDNLWKLFRRKMDAVCANCN